MKLHRLTTTIILVSVFALLVPTLATAATFENPLSVDDPETAIKSTITSLIVTILSFSVIVALVSLLVGGLKLIFGGMGSESQIAEGKKIILWAVLGLMVIGAAWSIILAVRVVLGV